MDRIDFILLWVCILCTCHFIAEFRFLRLVVSLFVLVASLFMLFLQLWLWASANQTLLYCSGMPAGTGRSEL